jgi:sulfoxide reductase heme-binding subunit YedZ
MTKLQALPVVTLKGIRLSWWTGCPFFLLCLVPLFRLLWRGFRGDLTANPIQFITYSTGDWTLRFLIVTLAITPLPFILNRPELFGFRRMAGFFGLFYGFLHLVNCMLLDKGLYTREMWDDIFRQRFIVVGLVGLLLVAPLSVTPGGWWVRRFGSRPSLLLHQAI